MADKQKVFNIKEQIENKLTSLIVIADINSITEITESSASNYKKIGYVTFSKPYHSFVDYFKIKKIDMNKFFFIDCITKNTIENPGKAENVVFAPGPNAFKEIEDIIRKVLGERKFDVLIFDSLSSLLIYEKEPFVTRFLHSLVSMIKTFNCKAILLVPEKDIEYDLIKNIGMLVDKTIYLI